MLRYWFFRSCLISLLSFSTHISWAQTLSITSPDELAFATDEMAKRIFEGAVKTTTTTEKKWDVSLNIGGSFSLTTNDNVVGADDGTTILMGALLSGAAVFSDKQHLWENALSLQETFSRSPGLDQFIKSVDQLDLQSTYTYRLTNPAWLGFFGRAALNTQVLVGEIVDDQPLVIARPLDPNTAPEDLNVSNISETFTADGDTSYQLTKPFEPLTLRQTLGVFAEPYTDEQLRFRIRLGMGAQELIFQGGEVFVTTIPAEEPIGDQTEIVIVRSLGDDVFELGIESELDVRGDLLPKKLSYYATLNAFYPPFIASGESRSFADSLNMKLKAGISLKIVQAVSVDYTLTVLRVPAVTTDLQVQNGLLISAELDII